MLYLNWTFKNKIYYTKLYCQLVPIFCLIKFFYLGLICKTGIGVQCNSTNSKSVNAVTTEITRYANCLIHVLIQIYSSVWIKLYLSRVFSEIWAQRSGEVWELYTRFCTLSYARRRDHSSSVFVFNIYINFLLVYCIVLNVPECLNVWQDKDFASHPKCC